MQRRAGLTGLLQHSDRICPACHPAQERLEPVQACEMSSLAGHHRQAEPMPGLLLLPVLDRCLWEHGKTGGWKSLDGSLTGQYMTGWTGAGQAGRHGIAVPGMGQNVSAKHAASSIEHVHTADACCNVQPSSGLRAVENGMQTWLIHQQQAYGASAAKSMCTVAALLRPHK